MSVGSRRVHCLSAMRASGLLGILSAVLMLAPAAPAWCLPAFARAMQVPCSVCHTVAFGPALTAFGRNFKLHGYALATHQTIPLSAMIIASYTHTAADQPASPNYSSNDNLALDDIAGFFAGRIADHFGAFAEVTYDRIDRHTSWGILDARYARDVTIGTTSTVLGVSLNNYPTAQDLWNSTAAWQFPFPATRLANQPAAAPQIYGFYAQQTLGATFYAMLNDLVYLEAGGYRKLGDRFQSAFGVPDPQFEHAIVGTAPYWRVAVQKSLGSHYVSAGMLGFLPDAQSPPERGIGTDSYKDIGFDATYQFSNGGPHTLNVDASYIHEDQNLVGSVGLVEASTASNRVDTFTITGQYAYRQTYSFTLGYFDLFGNSDALLYPPGVAWFGSANNSPDSRYWILQAEVIPFGKITSFAHPLLNLRVGVRYISYSLFNGGSSNYDGFGHSAHDNDTTFVYIWSAI